MKRPEEDLHDELLVLRCQEGSREAFELLVRRWQEPLWRHALRQTGSEDAAWEVLQETWMVVARGIRRLDDPARFRRWAFRIATRRAVERFRRRSPASLDDDGTVAPSAVANDRTTALRDALDRLSPDAHTVLCLRHLEGFDLWEIAEILGIPEGTVKSRLHHARRELRDIIERSEP